MITQQTDTADPQLRQQLDALVTKFDEAKNKNDAAAVAALFTEDAILVTDTGPIYGRDAIEKSYAGTFQQIHFSNHLGQADPNSIRAIGTVGDEIWSNGEWSVTLQGQSGSPIQLKGYWSAVQVREDGAWKDRMQTWNVTPAPAAETK
jgi:uncharacterized protein (TIGR02246 family)